jgi:hypothetical protein
MKRILLASICLILSIFVSGCSRLAKTALPTDHLGYNRAVNSSINQQLLINIVRAHFNESALYVSIENVTSRHSYQDEFGASFFNPFNTGGAATALHTLTLSGKSTVKEEPSFIYAPQTNDKYAIELLQPLRIKALYLVIESESDLGDILRLMLRRMGPYLNFEARPIMKPYLHNVESIRSFVRMTQIIDKIYSANDYIISVKANKDDTIEELKLPIPRGMRLSSHEWRLLASLGIKRGDPYIILCAGEELHHQKDAVHIQVRSLMNVTDFLSFAVVPPQNDHTRRMLLDGDNGKTFRAFQKLLTKYMMHIRVSSSKPSNPFVAIKRRGMWYYINENDVSSKITFRLFRIFNDVTQANTSPNNILISS